MSLLDGVQDSAASLSGRPVPIDGCNAAPPPVPWAELPYWLEDVQATLPVAVHYLMTGNTTDRYLVQMQRPGPAADKPGFHLIPLLDALWLVLQAWGYEAMLVHDPVDHVRVLPDTDAAREAAQAVGVPASGRVEVSTARLSELMRAVVTGPRRLALVLDAASRTLGRGAAEIEPLLAMTAKLATSALARHPSARGPITLFNPVFWVLDSERDLPIWVTSRESVRTVPVPLPDLDTRLRSAATIGKPLLQGASKEQVDSFADTFAEQTDGMTLRAMRDIVQLAGHRRVPAADVEDAVRSYRVGVTHNPWKANLLRERIASGEATLAGKVLGQSAAVNKSLDILIRSSTGLSAAHSRGHAARPRGVLFFAGPTGVGKTEMAKSITQLVFGDANAYSRFDMSEYSAEQSEARLIGAPPGYIGHDAGGQLTDAVRLRPFSLLLFDEIEKAHPRILDKFLQILDDGRLTDGAGSTVHFSETLIVFTSNLGVRAAFESAGAGTDPASVTYEHLEQVIRVAIEDHFTTTLGRPELLNRIGVDNIVVFDLIRPDTARQLVAMYLDNVCRRVRSELGYELVVEPGVRRQLEERAVGDLRMGGRGIGTLIETLLVNPLGRAIVREHRATGSTLRVVALPASLTEPLVLA